MTIRRMRIACWILKATNTHTEYVILIALPLQQWLHERSSVLPRLFAIVRQFQGHTILRASDTAEFQMYAFDWHARKVTGRNPEVWDLVECPSNVVWDLGGMDMILSYAKIRLFQNRAVNVETIRRYGTCYETIANKNVTRVVRGSIQSSRL